MSSFLSHRYCITMKKCTFSQIASIISPRETGDWFWSDLILRYSTYFRMIREISRPSKKSLIIKRIFCLL